MENHKDCFVSGAFSAVLRVSKYLGTAPLQFLKQGDGWKISLAPKSAMFGRFVITVTGLLYLWITFYDKFFSPEVQRSVWSITQRTVRFTESVVITGIAVWIVYRSLEHMKHLIGCLNQVQKINSELNVQNWPAKQKKQIALLTIIWSIFCLVTFMCDYVAVTIFISQSEKWIKGLEILYFVHYTVIELRAMQFILVVLHVRSSFQAVNDHLRCLLRDLEKKQQLLGKNNFCKANYECITKLNNYISPMEDKKTTANSGKKTISLRDTFHGLSSAYGAACCVVRVVNRSEGSMLIMTLTFLLQHLISAPYFFVTNIIYGRVSLDEPSFIFYKLVLLSWSILQTLNLVLIIEPCHLTHMEMETTRELVSHLMRCTHSSNEPLALELEQFYKYLVLNEVSYKPLNVFTMTRGLVLKIFGSVTTYLVILIKI